jgi:hypothetical protein
MRFRLFFIDKLTRRIISLIELEPADAMEAVALPRSEAIPRKVWATGPLFAGTANLEHHHGELPAPLIDCRSGLKSGVYCRSS